MIWRGPAGLLGGLIWSLGWSWSLGCGSAAGAAQEAQAQPQVTAHAQAKPAMWRVKGEHGTVTLFGTVHVMKQGVAWETAAVKEALKTSDALYLEITELDPASLQKVQPVIMQMGLDPEHPLSTKISAEDVKALDAAAKGLGLPGEAALEPMKPWLVYATLSVLPALKAGYGSSSGIDPTLLAEAKSLGKPVKGLETAEGQVRLLASLPTEEQVKLLHQELEDLPQSVQRMNEMVADWTQGDVEKIAAMENDELKVKAPGLYDTMLVERNKGFTEQIVAMLKDPAGGREFVAIGAAHLAGPDSVVKMLEAKGYTVERVE